MGGAEGKANTLYLSAPSTEFDRLAPVLGGLLGDLREQIHAWDIAGRRLEKPLLILIDEAGQLELQWLPEEVSTIAGLGGMFVTGWQSRSQISHRYGTLADAVLGGHRSKVFFAGTDDPSTTDYVSKVAGLVHVPHRGWSADTGGGRKTVSEHDQREDLLPAHVLRQMVPQHAVLVHGTLPPVHLQLIRWWEDSKLRSLVPVDSKGRPAPPADVATCPVSDQSPSGVESVIDPAALEESLAKFPGPRPPRSDPPATPNGARRVRPVPPGQTQLDLDQTADRGDGPVVNRVAGKCEHCGTRVEVGAGQVVRIGNAGRARVPACLRVRSLGRSQGPTQGRTRGRRIRRVVVMARPTQRVEFRTRDDMAAHLDRWAARHLTDPAAWQDVLVGSRAWLDYSARNQVLLASYGVDGPVAGAETWRLVPSTHEGRTCAVRSGEHGHPVRVPVTTGGAEPDPYLGGNRPTRAAVERWEWRPVFEVAQLARRPAPGSLVAVDLPDAFSGPDASSRHCSTLPGRSRLRRCAAGCRSRPIRTRSSPTPPDG